MSATIVNGATTFGGMSNQAIDNLISAANAISRLQAAVADAVSGPGSTALEGGNFGVSAGQGAAYQSALGNLATALATFMTTNAGFITQLDNG